MSAKHWAIGLSLCAALAAAAVARSTTEDIAKQTLSIFDDAFASKVKKTKPNPILRVRDGSERFCIQENRATPTHASVLVSDLSDAFDLNWTQTTVEDLAQCPVETTDFYVLQGERPDQAHLMQIIKGIVGSAPPDPDKVFPKWALGLSISLPGSRRPEFVFATSQSGMPPEAARSIMSEELLQSILRGSDVATTKIVSLLAEDQRNTDYSVWFDYNPVGFCSVDIVLLELLIGPSTAHLTRMDEMRSYLANSFDDLLAAAAPRAKRLEAYRDPRCWIWEQS